MIRLRRTWFQIHKWVGIFLAILIIPLSLSGAALVWHDWLDRQVHPQRYSNDGAAVLAPSAYAEKALKLAQSGERISTMTFPGGEGSVQVNLTKPAIDGGRPSRATVWLNPKSADAIERGGPRDGILGVLHVLHGSLMVPGVGRQIVGWLGVAMLLSSLTGLWLWWPLKGGVLRGLRWERRPDFNSNLHHLGGFWIALPLAVLSATGVWISFPAVFNPLVGGSAASGPGGAAVPLMLPRQNVDQVLEAAHKLVPGKATTIAWPTDKKPEWTVTLKDRGAPAEVKVLDLNASARRSAPKPETFSRTMRRIHDGTGTPVVWQIVIFVGGILPAVLAVTGILMWLRTRRRRDKHRRAAAFAEAEALAS